MGNRGGNDEALTRYQIFSLVFGVVLALCLNAEFSIHLSSCMYGPGSSSSSINSAGFRYDYPKANSDELRRFCTTTSDVLTQFKRPLATLVASVVFFATCIVVSRWLHGAWRDDQRTTEVSSLKSRIVRIGSRFARAVLSIVLASIFSFSFTLTVHSLGISFLLAYLGNILDADSDLNVPVFSALFGAGFCLGLTLADSLLNRLGVCCTRPRFVPI